MTRPGAYRPARVGEAALVAVCTGVVGWVVTDWWSGDSGRYFPLPWTAPAGIAVLAAGVLVAGLPVRRWVRGRRDRPLDPLVAARTVVFAKAAAYGGAGLAGWYASQALGLWAQELDVVGGQLLIAGLAALAALGTSAAGFVVQRWCRVPKDPDAEA